MSAYEHMSHLADRNQSLGCCPVSSCWEAMMQNNSVRAASGAATSALLYDPAPLGLTLYAATDALSRPTTRAPAQLNPGLLDGLLREINHRKKTFSQRTIPWIKWQIPHQLLDSTDVTQLMYCLGRQFQLSSSPSSFYCVSFRVQEATAERVALFRGLGFNAIEFSVSAEERCDSGTLAFCASLAEDFHFQYFCIDWQTSSTRFYPALLESLYRRQPDCLAFKPADPESASASALLQTMYRDLTDRSYAVLGNDVYIRPDSPLAHAQQCGRVSRSVAGYNCQQVQNVLGLGPGNTSAFGSVRMTNPANLSQYLTDNFDHYRQDTVPAGILEVIDQLLCYHQLNLIYFAEQHQLDLEYLFSQLESPGRRHRVSTDGRLYGIKNNTLALTTAGVLQLSYLCQALARLQCR